MGSANLIDSRRTEGSRLGLAAAVILVVVAMIGLLVGRSDTAHAATQVDLGSAGSFAVLAGSTITNTGSTTLTGSAGLHPGTAVSGFDSVTFVSGQQHVADTTAASAKDDLVTAYNSAAGQGQATTVATELGGQLLPGGVYDSATGTFGLTGTLRLDAQGTPGTVWIFQTASTLITEVGSSVVLLNGADACNVFWQVGSSATLKGSTSFQGNILALESITLGSSTTIEGRALARNGAVTMDTNTITRANCQAQTTPAPSPTPSPAPAPSPAPSPSPSPAPSPTPSPTTSPAPVASPSPIAVPVDSTTGTPDAPTDTTGSPDAPTGATGSPDGPTTTPGAPDEPDVPVAAAPPSSGTPQVPAVPRGPVPAGDGSMATADRGAPGILLFPVLAGAVLFAAWRRRNA